MKVELVVARHDLGGAFISTLHALRRSSSTLEQPVNGYHNHDVMSMPHATSTLLRKGQQRT